MRNIGGVQKQPATEAPQETGKRRRVHWAFPLGLGLAGLASVAAVIFRGCRHTNMSWPIRAEDEHGHFSYQACNECGIMRLFDERAFRGYGPYGYDLHELIARERLQRRQRIQKAAAKARPESEAEDQGSGNGEQGIGLRNPNL